MLLSRSTLVVTTMSRLLCNTHTHTYTHTYTHIHTHTHTYTHIHKHTHTHHRYKESGPVQLTHAMHV